MLAPANVMGRYDQTKAGYAIIAPPSMNAAARLFRRLFLKLALLVPTLLVITALAFSLVRLIPGDPVEILSGERQLDPASHAAALHRLGLDRPLGVQYLSYLSTLSSGDFGASLVTREPVLDELRILFPATVELASVALGLAVLIGIPAGVLAAVWAGSRTDNGIMFAATVGFSMPVFWWGLILILTFSVQLGWTPVSGRIGVEYDVPLRTGFMLIDSGLSDLQGAFLSAVRHILLPAVVLATIPASVIARMTRSSMLEVLPEDFVRTARAKGMSAPRVLFVHALRGALVPVVTLLGMQMGSLLGGAVLTETIFSWPGIGKWLIDGVARRDYPVVQTGILVSALLFVAINMLVDMMYGVVDPRIARRRAR